MRKRKPSNLQVWMPLLKNNSPIVISACLLGFQCRYDGHHCLCPELVDFVSSYPFTPFCPEQLGGLPTPRPPANMMNGDGDDVLSGKAMLMDAEGNDVTEAFKKGARESLRLARLTGTSIAVMKDKSPSCGLKSPYCETPSGHGTGVTAALFLSSGIRIFELGSNDLFPNPEFLKFIKETC